MTDKINRKHKSIVPELEEELINYLETARQFALFISIIVNVGILVLIYTLVTNLNTMSNNVLIIGIFFFIVLGLISIVSIQKFRSITKRIDSIVFNKVRNRNHKTN